MATHADISGNLTLGALQAVRRNVTDTAFEAYTPYTQSSAATTYPIVVTTILLTDQTADIASTNMPGTDVPGLYRFSYYLITTATDAAAGIVWIDFAWTDIMGSRTGSVFTGDTTIALNAVDVATLTRNVQTSSGYISYTTTHTGIYGTAKYALYIVVERLADMGARTTLAGSARGTMTYRATLSAGSAGLMQLFGGARGTATVRVTPRGTGAARGTAAGRATVQLRKT